MKKIFLTCSLLASLTILGNMAIAQSVSISNANVITCNNINAVNVSGTLAGSKGVPITAYTVDLISAGKTVRIATNVASNGGPFNYIGFIPAGTTISAPIQIKVTTNRQINASADASTCK